MTNNFASALNIVGNFTKSIGGLSGLTGIGLNIAGTLYGK